MKCFKKNIGENGAEATFYLQEPNKEIDINRKSPVMIVVPGGAYMWTSWRQDCSVCERECRKVGFRL